MITADSKFLLGCRGTSFSAGLPLMENPADPIYAQIIPLFTLRFCPAVFAISAVIICTVTCAYASTDFSAIASQKHKTSEACGE
jgi:hypothetical protein